MLWMDIHPSSGQSAQIFHEDGNPAEQVRLHFRTVLAPNCFYVFAQTRFTKATFSQAFRYQLKFSKNGTTPASFSFLFTVFSNRQYNF